MVAEGAFSNILKRMEVHSRPSRKHVSRRSPTFPGAMVNCRSGISAAQALFTAGTSTTMSVEPGLVDTNVLVYALDADAAQHASSRALLEAGRAGSVTRGCSKQSDKGASATRETAEAVGFYDHLRKPLIRSSRFSQMER
jgi:hypothetical protein